MQKALILEDHMATCEWLSEVLDYAFVNIDIKLAASIAQAEALLDKYRFDLVLVELNLPDGAGADFISRLKQRSPETYCVVTTKFDNDEYLFPALRAGAQGYLLKELGTHEFVNNLRGILKGTPPISPSITTKMIQHFHIPKTASVSTASDLSGREKEILSLIASGKSRKQVAEQLNISPNTVATHTKAIYSKLGVSNKSEATLEALRLGLVQV